MATVCGPYCNWKTLLVHRGIIIIVASVTAFQRPRYVARLKYEGLGDRPGTPLVLKEILTTDKLSHTVTAASSSHLPFSNTALSCGQIAGPAALSTPHEPYHGRACDKQLPPSASSEQASQGACELQTD